MDVAIDSSRIVDDLLADSALGALTAPGADAPLPLDADRAPMLLSAARASFGRLALSLVPLVPSHHEPFVLPLPDWPGLDPDAIAEAAALFIRFDVAARINAAASPADARRLAAQADEALRLLRQAVCAAAPRPRRIRPGV